MTIPVPGARLVRRLFGQFRRLARIHEPLVLAVAAGREACLSTLAASSRPSTDRLHLRDLFREGRRYHLSPTPAGFRLYTDARRWGGSGAGRTTAAAILDGELVALGDSPGSPVTLLRLRASIRPAHVLAALAFPAFVALLVLGSPIESAWKLLLVLALIGLATLAQRFEAAWQASAMVEFVRKALNDLPQVESARLEPGRGPSVEQNAAFSEAWNRFYAEQTERQQA